MNRVLRTRIAGAFRRTALPLASYYAITLVLPLANGAARSGAFVEHAVVVLIVPPVAIVLAAAIHALAHARRTPFLPAVVRGCIYAVTADPSASQARQIELGRSRAR